MKFTPNLLKVFHSLDFLGPHCGDKNKSLHKFLSQKEKVHKKKTKGIDSEGESSHHHKHKTKHKNHTSSSQETQTYE